MEFIKKHKIITSVFAFIFFVIFLDLVLWRIDVNHNKNILNDDIASTIYQGSLIPEITESCRVNESKGFKTTSCGLWADLVLVPESSIESTLESYFNSLSENDWNTNFEEFKTELLAGKSRFDNQRVRFYHDDYDPNGDHDFIDVYRVDNGVVLSDTGVQSSELNANTDNLVVIRFHRDQRSSLSHYIIGQFVNF